MAVSVFEGVFKFLHNLPFAFPIQLKGKSCKESKHASIIAERSAGMLPVLSKLFDDNLLNLGLAVDPLADHLEAVGMHRVLFGDLIEDGTSPRPCAAEMRPQNVEDVAVSAHWISRGWYRPPPQNSLAGDLVNAKAVWIDPPAEEVIEAHARAYRFPFITANGLAGFGVDKPATRPSPLCAVQESFVERCQMILAPPIIVVEVSDISAVREIAKDRPEMPPIPRVAEPAITSRRRVAWIEHEHGMPIGN